MKQNSLLSMGIRTKLLSMNLFLLVLMIIPMVYIFTQIQGLQGLVTEHQGMMGVEAGSMEAMMRNEPRSMAGMEMKPEGSTMDMSAMKSSGMDMGKEPMKMAGMEMKEESSMEMKDMDMSAMKSSDMEMKEESSMEMAGMEMKEESSMEMKDMDMSSMKSSEMGEDSMKMPGMEMKEEESPMEMKGMDMSSKDSGEHNMAGMGTDSGMAMGGAMGQFEKVVQQSEELTTVLLILGAIILVISLSFGYFMANTITNPIDVLQQSAAQLAQGNLNQNIDVGRRDELGALAQSFADMRDAIRLKIEDLSKLNGTGELLAGMFEQTEALETVLKVLQEKTHVEKGSVYLLDDQDQLQIKAFYPAETPAPSGNPKSFKLGEGIIGKSAQDKKIIYIPDSSENTDFIGQGDGGSKALLCVPLMDGEKLYGILNFSGVANRIKFDESDREFAQTLANMTVVTTKNIKMVNVIEEYSHTLEDKVEERTAAIKDLLDNTGQGFFSFGNDYQINPEYSKACIAFFGKSIDGQNALDLMFGIHEESQKEEFLSDEENLTASKKKEPHPDSVRELLDMVFEGLGDMAILGDLLPSEIRVGDLILDVSFNLIETEQQDKRFMVVLTDVTVERQLAEQISAEEELNTMIIKVALDREGFIQFLNEIEELFFSIYRLLAQSPDQINHHELFRYFHTIKGGAASYSLKVVAEKAHEIEECLEDVRSGEKKLANELIIHLVNETFELQKIFIQTLDKLSSIILDEDRKQVEKVYKIRDSKMSEIRDYLLDKLAPNTIDTVRYAMDQLRRQPIGPILNKYAMTAEGLADQLNKPVNIQIKGKNVEVPHEQLESFFGSLVHLVRNCVDHGLEDQDVRNMLGKTEKGTITIEAFTKNKSLIIQIADDGGGIDAEIIKDIALKKGIINTDYANSASENELVQLILAPGFTTKEDVSDISGRGVGMDAVKTTVDELQGNILIKTKIDLGTKFEIMIPNVIQKLV